MPTTRSNSRLHRSGNYYARHSHPPWPKKSSFRHSDAKTIEQEPSVPLAANVSRKIVFKGGDIRNPAILWKCPPKLRVGDYVRKNKGVHAGKGGVVHAVYGDTVVVITPEHPLVPQSGKNFDLLFKNWQALRDYLIPIFSEMNPCFYIMKPPQSDYQDGIPPNLVAEIAAKQFWIDTWKSLDGHIHIPQNSNWCVGWRCDEVSSFSEFTKWFGTVRCVTSSTSAPCILHFEWVWNFPDQPIEIGGRPWYTRWRVSQSKGVERY